MNITELFEQFWSAYPRRIAKGNARKAFERAIRKTTIDAMMTAIAAYKAHKPDSIDYKHPATWLNGECWDDEWELQRMKPQKSAATVRHESALDLLNNFLGDQHDKPGSSAFDIDLGRGDWQTH